LFCRCLVLHSFNNTILSWRCFINLAVSSPCKMSFIFLFVVILQCSLSFNGLCIFLTFFLSNILSAFISSMAVVQVSDP
jgi:hypothetical protein